MYTNLSKVVGEYDDENIGEFLSRKDPSVMGTAKPDIEDPIFQEFIEAKIRSKNPAQKPSSFNLPDEVGLLHKCLHIYIVL